MQDKSSNAVLSGCCSFSCAFSRLCLLELIRERQSKAEIQKIQGGATGTRVLYRARQMKAMDSRV